MTIQRVRAPSPGTTPDSFSDSTPLTRGPLDHLNVDRIHVPPPPERRYQLRQIHRPDHGRRNLLLGGVGALAALGVAVGLMAQPDFGWLQRATSTMPPPPPIDSVTSAPAIAAAPEMAPNPLPVEVAAAPRPPAPERADDPAPRPLPVAAPARPSAPAAMRTKTVDRSPKNVAPSTPRLALVAPMRPQVDIAAKPRLAEPAPSPARAALAIPTLDTPVVAATRPPPAVIRPGFNCAAAHNVSTRMVCADPELASYDRQLNGAYAQAVRAGVPRADLRADQDDWLQIREDAAHYSRQAVINVYRQRIGELNALARRPETYESAAR